MNITATDIYTLFSNTDCYRANIILQTVAHFYSCSTQAILSRCRTSDLVWARQVAMYLTRTRTRLSLPKIGKIYRRDHGTVLHSYRAVESRMSIDDKAARDVGALVEFLDNAGRKVA